MIRRLAAGQTRKSLLLRSVQTDWCYTDSGPPEPIIITALFTARLFLPPPEHFPFGEGSAPEEGTPRGSGERLRGKGLVHTLPEGRELCPPVGGAPSRRARGGSSPGAINLADIRYLEPGSCVGNSSFWRTLRVRR